MKLFSRFLPLLAFAVTAFTCSAQAALTVSITDNLQTSRVGSVAQHDPIGHWETFSTTLTARVNGAPQPTSETTIVGPVYTWSGGTSQIQRSSNHGETITLQSVFPPTAPLPAGQNNIAISCSATYTRNNSAGTPIETIPVPATTLTVRFWSRVPKKVKEISRYSAPGSPYFGSPGWGQETDFDLQVQDNQSTPQPYGFGKVKEEFPPASVTGAYGTTQPNGPGGGDTWNIETPGATTQVVA